MAIPGMFPVMVVIEGAHMEPIGPAVMSVRELITELSGVEDDLRRARHSGATGDPEPAVAEIVHTNR